MQEGLHLRIETGGDKMSRNPYADAFYNYPTIRAPRVYQRQRYYERPQRYNASRDMNDTARFVVAGAVTIGTLGLLGGMFNR
jgi:hypothetical protein